MGIAAGRSRARIAVSDPPDNADFIASRQEGGADWSHRIEAEQLAGIEATRQAEQDSDLPSPIRNRLFQPAPHCRFDA